MLPDYHTHTSFSADSSTPPEEQIRQAIRLGMPEICTTDHHDYDSISHLDFTLDTEAYIKAMPVLKERYQDQISVKIGVELGLQNHLTDYLESYSQKYPFDFIIGSIHFIDRQDLAHDEFFEGRSLPEAYELYMKTTLENVRAHRCYDVLGHLDYMTRYREPLPDGEFLRRYGDLIDEILKTLIETGKGIECNTAGYVKNQRRTNPEYPVLRRYRELGGEILTVGSDGHQPDRIGLNFDLAREALLDCGFRYYTTFEQRKPSFHPL